MVDLIQAYRAIDKSLCDVAESIVPIKVLPFENKKQKVKGLKANQRTDP